MSLQYQLTDLVHKSVFHPWSAVLDQTQTLVNHELNPLRHTALGRLQVAWLESASRLVSHYPKRGFGLAETEIDGHTVAVNERVLVKKPFCHLLHFETPGCETRPKVLFVAALSGHHATLSRETYSAFLPDHDVYVTDWQDARYVPLAEGDFGFEDYIRYVTEFLDYIGPDTHVIAICQAAVPTLAAIAVMAEATSPNRPKTMTLMAGPVDVRANPNKLTKISKVMNARVQRALTIHKVPAGYPGAGRRVYPGMLQLVSFMALNVRSHLQKHWQYFLDVYHNEHDAANKHREFYDEYFAVLDMTESYFIETLERVFFDQQLPKGTMKYAGSKISCEAITDIPLMTVEGAEDDMCQVGMTAAAHDICTGLNDAQRRHHVQPGVGHYGVFSGSRYSHEVAPRIKDFITSHSANA